MKKFAYIDCILLTLSIILLTSALGYKLGFGIICLAWAIKPVTKY